MTAIRIDDQGLAHVVPVIEAASDEVRLLDLADRLEDHAATLWRRVLRVAEPLPLGEYPIGDGRGVILHADGLSIGSVPASGSEIGARLWHLIRRSDQVYAQARRLRLRVGPGVVVRP